MGKIYDIFISYKRKSLPTANNLYYRLTTRGYSTFFDLEEMRRDNFDVQLLNYIDNAKDVFIILEEGSLDACILTETSDDVCTLEDGTRERKAWKEDWFCHEIAFALEKKKNIIPILLNGFKMPAADVLPREMKELSLKNSPEFSFGFFDEYLNKIIKKGYITSEPKSQNKTTSVFKFYSNEDCQILKDGKLVCSLKGGNEEPFYLPVSRKGEYEFKCVNTHTSRTQKLSSYIDTDSEKIVIVKWRNVRKILFHIGVFLLTICVFACLLMAYIGYSRFSNCKSVADFESYQSKTIIEDIIWIPQKDAILNEAYSTISELESLYGCVINKKITPEKLEVLREIFENTSYMPDYCDECDMIYVGKYEVSEREWNTFMRTDSDTESASPITNITYHEVVCFLDTLSFYSGREFSLPTTQQWELYATANCNYIYAGSNDAQTVAWYQENSGKVSHSWKDSTLMPNNYDLFNMSGNVAEMCRDSSVIGSICIKGGHFESSKYELKIDETDFLDENESSKYIGCRLIIK